MNSGEQGKGATLHAKAGNTKGSLPKNYSEFVFVTRRYGPIACRLATC
jgi:hypothetical protein